MKRFATELEFISRIDGSGLSLSKLSNEENKERQQCKFDRIYKLKPLSLSNKTYIASSVSTYVVKLKN